MIDFELLPAKLRSFRTLAGLSGLGLDEIVILHEGLGFGS